jgi:predicted transcriptional regulator
MELKIGSQNNDLNIIEDFDLQKYRIENKTIATMLYSFDNPYDLTERLTQRDIIVFDHDGKEHNLKYRDSTDEYNSLVSQEIMKHIITSFKIHLPN